MCCTSHDLCDSIIPKPNRNVSWNDPGIWVWELRYAGRRLSGVIRAGFYQVCQDDVASWRNLISRLHLTCMCWITPLAVWKSEASAFGCVWLGSERKLHTHARTCVCVWHSIDGPVGKLNFYHLLIRKTWQSASCKSFYRIRHREAKLWIAKYSWPRISQS